MFLFDQEAYARKRLDEIQQQINYQQHTSIDLKKELKLLESIFDIQASAVADQYLNIFKEDKNVRVSQNLTREEKIRNIGFIVTTVLAVLASFYRADFVTIVIFLRAFQYLNVKWKINYYWQYASALTFSIVYDLLW